MRRAAVVFPVHGSPTVKNRIGCLIITTHPSRRLGAETSADGVAGEIAILQKRNGGSAPSFTQGVALYPPFPSGSLDSAHGYIMSSGTQHPNEAWTWLSFLSKQLVAEPNGGKNPLEPPPSLTSSGVNASSTSAYGSTSPMATT